MSVVRLHIRSVVEKQEAQVLGNGFIIEAIRKEAIGQVETFVACGVPRCGRRDGNDCEEGGR
jgi:hypothetical protein